MRLRNLLILLIIVSFAGVLFKVIFVHDISGTNDAGHIASGKNVEISISLLKERDQKGQSGIQEVDVRRQQYSNRAQGLRENKALYHVDGRKVSYASSTENTPQSKIPTKQRADIERRTGTGNANEKTHFTFDTTSHQNHQPAEPQVIKFGEPAPNEVTIVTGFFRIPSKRPSTVYLSRWIPRMFCLNANLLVFTNEDLIPTLRAMRPEQYRDSKTVFVASSIEEFSVANRYPRSVWDFHLRIDPERAYHSVYLYWVWNEKASFLKQAVELNPYRSDYFMWVDIGCFRGASAPYCKGSPEWPVPGLIPRYLGSNSNSNSKSNNRNRTLQALVYPYAKEDLYVTPVPLPPYPSPSSSNKNNNNNKSNNRVEINATHWVEPKRFGKAKYRAVASFVGRHNRIGGTIYGGHRDAVLTYHDEFYAVMDRYVYEGLFAGKDQSLMNALCLQTPELCLLLDSKTAIRSGNYGDRWFILQPFFAGRMPDDHVKMVEDVGKIVVPRKEAIKNYKPKDYTIIK